VKSVDIAVTTSGYDYADLVYDGSGYPCQYEWGVYGCDVTVKQWTQYIGWRHLALALIAQGAIKIRWVDLLNGKISHYNLNNIDELLR